MHLHRATTKGFSRAQNFSILKVAVRRNKNFYNAIILFYRPCWYLRLQKKTFEIPKDPPWFNYNSAKSSPKAGLNDTEPGHINSLWYLCLVWQWYIPRVCPVGSQCGGRTSLWSQWSQHAAHGQAVRVPLADLPRHGGVRLAHQAGRQGQVSREWGKK